jgi:hypothetical protein
MIRNTGYGLLVLAGFLMAAGTVSFGATGAEGLVDRLPEDVLGFVATSGSDEVKPAFDQSHVGQLWHEASVQTFYGQIKKVILDQMGKEPKDNKTKKNNREKAEKDLVWSLGELAVKCPGVAGVAERPGVKDFPVCIFVIVEAGKYRAELDETIKKLEALNKKSNKVVEMNFGGTVMRGEKEKDWLGYWGWVGNYFMVVFNDESGKLVLDFKKEKPAGSKAGLAGLMAKVPGAGDAMVMGVDMAKVFRLLEGKLEGAETVNAVLGNLGLKDIRAMVSRTGFSGADLVGNGLLALPEGRRGLLGVLKPVDPSWLDLAPAGVTTAAVYNIDFGSLYDTVLTTIKSISDKEGFEVDKAIGEFEEKAQVKIRQELLGNLAGPVVSYAVPGATINPMSGGAVFIVKLKNSKEFEKSFTALEEYIAKIADGNFQTTSQAMDGVNYHFWMIPQLAMAQISPCWTISRDELVFTTNMPLCSVAVRHATTQHAEASSVRTTEGFKSVAKELPEKLLSLRYVDQKVQGEEGMRAMQQFWPMMAMMVGQQSKIKLPMILPPAADIAKHLGPQVEYCWETPEGIRSHSRGPLMGSDASMAAAGGVMAGMIAPALCQARDAAKRAQSSANLRQVFIACYEYSNEKDHAGKLPANLEDLVKAGKLNKAFLESALKPKEFTGPSYIYISEIHNVDTEPRNILAYENPAYLSEGTTVLFGDGHVQWMKPEEFKKSLAETYQRLGKPMPAVNFRAGKGGWDLGNLFKSEKAPIQLNSGVNLDKKIPFKCTTCGKVVMYTIRDLQKMQKPGQMGPMMGPMTLDCPKCEKKTLTQAVECPKCGEIFVMKMDPAKGLFNDKCPKCHESYAKAWQEKYKKSKQE